jgi:hypothetical protein
MKKPHIWLRAETKPQEQRTALTPTNAKKLLESNFNVTIEKSVQNIFPDKDYQEVGCQMVESGTWINAPKDAIILGLKELPEDNFELNHQHIFFAHVYKEQQGWQALLSRFKNGGGKLYDLEYLIDEHNRRIAAFGYWAGFAGAALAIQAWVNQQNNSQPPLKDIRAYQDQSQLTTKLSNELLNIATKPRIIIVGAKGRSGQGAVKIAKTLGLETIEWDLAETQKGGPFFELNQFDILVNCVFISGPANGEKIANFSPFITNEMLNQQQRQLAIICDVSCDPYGNYNPLPIYHQCTTFKQPCLELITGEKPLNLIAIDHLPSLLPKESSEDYGQQLVKHLLGLNNIEQGVWPKALKLFNEKTATI